MNDKKEGLIKESCDYSTELSLGDLPRLDLASTEIFSNELAQFEVSSFEPEMILIKEAVESLGDLND